MPVQNKKALRIRNSLSCTSVLSGEHDGADQRGEEQHRDDLERHDKDPEDVLSYGAGAPERDERFAEMDLLAPEGVDEQRDEDPKDEEGRHERAPPLVVVQALSLAPHGSAGEHDPEQEQDDHRADVDEDLNPGDEFGCEQDVLGRRTSQDDDEEQRRVDDVAGPDHTDRGGTHRDGEQPEGDLLLPHGATSYPSSRRPPQVAPVPGRTPSTPRA